MRLIDADELKTAMDECIYSDRDRFSTGYAKSFIDNAPTVDAVPVVRCKDCQYVVEHHYEDAGCPPYIKYTCGCRYGLTKVYAVSENNFCCHGERKGGDE